MKREFLQELKVGTEPLPKAVIDAIMAENGRDIEAAKASVDAESLKSQIAQLEEKLAEAEKNHAQQLDAVAMDAAVRDAVTAAHGRNLKAITALLDMDALRAAENRELAVKQAVEALKKEEAYLFGDPTPPPYAGATGTTNPGNQHTPDSLAGALREKFERK